MLLHGRPYDLRDQTLRASFHYGGSDSPSYEYFMPQDDDGADIKHFRVNSSVTLPAGVHPPPVQELSYQFNKDGTGTLAANCTNTNTSSTAPCMEGSFQGASDKRLSVAVTNSSGATRKLDAVDEGSWAPLAADDAPNFKLVEDVHRNAILQTVVTKRGACSLLKLCLNPGDEDVDFVPSLAAIGLALLAQDKYAKLCTTPSSN